MHKDCIILCHQTDSRGNLLCLHEINGIPFIEYVTAYLSKFHICKVIFSISAQREKFKEYVLANRTIFSFAFDFSEQDSDLGTGAAVLNSLQYSDTPDVFIMQGHRYFDVNLDDLIAWQQTKMGDVTLALSYQQDTDDYLLAHLDGDNMIHELNDGQQNQSGLISSGVYCLFRASFLNINFPQQFSFENDYLKKQIKERDYIGMICEATFYDLRKASSLVQAQKELNPL